MNTSEVNKKTAIATRWSVFTELIAKLISPVTNMILARLLTPDAFGVIATIMMVISFADMFTDAGFQKYLIQHNFKTKEELDKSTCVAFWTNLVFSIFLWIVIFIFADKIAFLVGNKGLGNVIIIAAISLPLTSFSSIQMARYKKDFNFKTLFFVRVVGILIPIFITVPIAFFYRNYWALVIGTISGNLINAILLTKYSNWKPSFFYDFKILKNIFSFSWWVLMESISVWLTAYIGTFIIGSYFSSYYLGIYKTSITIVEQIVIIIVASTSAPLFSALSKLQNDMENFKDVYYKYMKAIGMIVIPMGVGIFLYKNFITLFLLGDQWKEATDFIGLWGVLSSFCLIFGTYNSGIYNAKGVPKLSFLAQILYLVVLIPVLYISSKYGFKVLYISRSLVRLEFVLVQSIITWIYFKMSPFKTLKEVFSSMICTCIMILGSLILKKISSNMGWDFISIIICIVLYFLSMYIFYKKDLENNLKVLGINLKLKQSKKEKYFEK